MTLRVQRLNVLLVALLSIFMTACISPGEDDGNVSAIVVTGNDNTGGGDTGGGDTGGGDTGGGDTGGGTAEAFVISNLVFSNVTTTAFDASIDYTGDSNSNASVSFNYCNQTDNPGCNPESGSSMFMTEVSGGYVANIIGLSTPNDPGDILKVKVNGIDPDVDGVSVLSSIVTLDAGTSSAVNDITVSNLSSSTTSNSISVSVNFTGDENSNAIATLNYCNNSDNANCNPVNGSSSQMSRSGSKFSITINNMNSPNDPGDVFNLLVSVDDSDGVTGGSLSDTIALANNGDVITGLACGSTISSSGSYALDQNLSCSGDWITVTASNVSINMSGYTVSYGQSSSGSRAIELNGSVSNFSLSGNGVINSGTNSGHAVFSNNDNINGLDIGNITFNMISTSGDAIRFANSPSATMNINIHDNVMNMNPVSSAYVTGIFFDGGGNGSYTGSINNNAMTLGVNAASGRPSGIAVVFPNSQISNPLSIHSNSFTLNGVYNNGIRLYGSDGFVIHDNTITVTSVGNNAKPIQLDGGSSYNDVYANTIDVNSTDTISSTYAIRIRFDASHNKVHANTINIEDSSGSYPAYGIVLGSTEGGVTPNGNDIYDNVIVGANQNIPIAFYEDSGQQLANNFYNNTVVNSGTGPCITFYPVTASTPIYSLHFANESYSTGGSTKVRIPSYAGANSIHEATWCGSNIVDGEVEDVNNIGGWSITSSACSL